MAYVKGFAIIISNFLTQFVGTITADRTYTLPDKNITVAGLDDVIDVRTSRTIVKADGFTTGINRNCDFTSINAAVVAGFRSMFMLGAFPHTGVTLTTATAGNSINIRSNINHGFSVGDEIVFTQSDIDGSKFMEGVYIITVIISAQDFTVVLKSNSGEYSGKVGGFATGKNVSFHKGDKTTLTFLAATGYTGLRVEGENNGLATMTGGNCIDMLASGITADFITFKNIGLRPSAVGGKCININANAVLKKVKFIDCLFNGFFNAVWNGGLWGGALGIAGSPSVNGLSFINCDVVGITDSPSDTIFQFDNFAGGLGNNLLIKNCDFDTINGLGVAIFKNCLGWKVIETMFDNIYNNAIKVDGTGAFTSDGVIDGCFFRNGANYEHA